MREGGEGVLAVHVSVVADVPEGEVALPREEADGTGYDTNTAGQKRRSPGQARPTTLRAARVCWPAQ